jgi:MoxR-like ATPase
MDRFFMRLSLGYPDKGEEMKIISRFKAANPLSELKPVANGGDIVKIQKEAEQIYVDFRITEYIVNIIRNTRQDEFAALGASPRATVNLCRAAQALAMYNERDYVAPDDIIKLSEHVLAHRIVLKQEAKLKKITQRDIIERAVAHTHVPVV